ncbi:MAG: hypothetical protein R6U50_11110 [Desulfobacterales bacterium]
MAAQTTHTNTEFSLTAIDTIIHRIEKKIREGELLLKNGSINRESLECWEHSACLLLKKSAHMDPVVVNRFLYCGTFSDTTGYTGKSFPKTRCAMSLYDKIRILDYHIGMLKREKKFASR